MTKEHADERAAIVEASARLLDRSPTEARPTIVELLRNVEIPRWKLTHRHRDLNDGFLAAVERKWGSDSPSAAAGIVKLAALQAKYQLANERLVELEALIDVYAVALEELRRQNDELTQASKRNVLAFPTR
ncbi:MULTISPECIES: hypothetical protein [unclassified Cryobacterium]|uniref:hypothetical protein n=1 Tax=unclassified Cryobacterium TaxID=2649013 RepID=UPI002AB5947E|nr:MULTISPECIES: hypothetical protein [unclassified Cryobacterium]MDY7528129.1 hypothetical protein [Cryobacterium sp. 10C2]MDY7556122.1 hypothetical protein [Cryobacterium sp. 10C3]MEB0292588.1 hypothetical protein [Cryobacterium sp. 10C2]